MPTTINKFWGHDPVFSRACKLAEVAETHRQYRKWCRGFGSAFAKKAEAVKAA